MQQAGLGDITALTEHTFSRIIALMRITHDTITTLPKGIATRTQGLQEHKAHTKIILVVIKDTGTKKRKPTQSF